MANITEHQPRRPPLPDSWIRKLFAEMHGNYGAKWVQMWATGERLQDGSDAGMKVAMSVWAEKLAGFADKPEAVRAVLNSLPDQVPTLPKFLELCREQARKIAPTAKMIENTLTEDQIRANRERIASMVQGLARKTRAAP